ncbi:hypothetical protein COCNU_10G008930 [Cocos nucifera]|uniref:Uncharacterized protein n=1 Tax=Cocos nucifera TaxID=13894 RepID=A0A8K0IN06_COCNU|nr:hypothetical protein COCNU_10G008930 [Cocos nucifera]
MSCIAYLEFIQICCDAFDGEQGVGIARSLDESGAVIVLGNVVFLLGVFRHEHHGRVGGGGGNSGIRAIRWPYRGGGASACAAADPRGSAGGSADEPTSCSKRSMGHLLWSIMH